MAYKIVVEAAEQKMRRRGTVGWLQSRQWMDVCAIICGFRPLRHESLRGDICDGHRAWSATYCSLIESVEHTAP